MGVATIIYNVIWVWPANYNGGENFACFERVGDYDAFLHEPSSISEERLVSSQKHDFLHYYFITI